MTWFIAALLASVLWSVVNFVDKLLTERFVPERSVVLALSAYTALFSALALPVIFAFNPQILSVALGNALTLIFAGCIEMIAIMLYLRALQHEDTSTIIPFFQSVPVFSFILGFFFLGEMLTGDQFIGSIGILFGGVLLSLDLTKGATHRFKLNIIGLMLAASFCYAAFDALFKYATVQEDFWTGVFWQHVGVALFGIAILSFRAYRKRFGKIVRGEGPWVFSLNLLNEGLYAGGVMLSSYALLLAPIALVSLVNVYQPMFVFAIGILFSIFAPRILREETDRKSLILKAFAILIILLSSIYLINATPLSL